mmetsp:Transcript_22294/g.70017  ORF Transcript_22294/g.70017 Transcript_22294/m.70017 type:complete len:267 (+) Transcript_22294:118-918(+)
MQACSRRSRPSQLNSPARGSWFCVFGEASHQAPHEDPELLHGAQPHALPGRMRADDVRAEGHHLHARNLASDEAALQAGVYRRDVGGCGSHLHERAPREREQGLAGVGRPTREHEAALRGGAAPLGCPRHPPERVLECRRDRGAREADHLDGRGPDAAHPRHVVGGLHQAGHLVGHLEDSVRQSIEEVQQLGGALLAEGPQTCAFLRLRAQLELQAGVHAAELGPEVRLDATHGGLRLRQPGRVDADQDHPFAGDRVVKVPAVQIQ